MRIATRQHSFLIAKSCKHESVLLHQSMYLDVAGFHCMRERLPAVAPGNAASNSINDYSPDRVLSLPQRQLLPDSRESLLEVR